MKIFLTGASGILGSDIFNLLELENHEVLPFTSSTINLKSYSDVKTKVIDFKPDVVIHCAAMTNVDLCEDDKKAALQINMVGSQNLAMASNKIDSKIVYISSCGVYGGVKQTPYNELDSTNPLNYHHYTKLEGEKRIKEHNNQFLIVRPGWLFGGTTSHRKNFVEARRKEAEGVSTLSSAADKFGSPTYTLDLAKQILKLIDGDYLGTFNAVNEGRASRFEYVSEIVKLFNFNATVNPVNSNSFPRKANMPDNECLENLNLDLFNVNGMRNWKDALREYITITYNI